MIHGTGVQRNTHVRAHVRVHTHPKSVVVVGKVEIEAGSGTVAMSTKDRALIEEIVLPGVETVQMIGIRHGVRRRNDVIWCCPRWKIAAICDAATYVTEDIFSFSQTLSKFAHRHPV